MGNFLKRSSIIVWCIALLGALSFTQVGYAADKGIPVLLYHRVGYTNDALTVKPERLRNDLIKLKKNGYSTISLEMFEQYITGKNVEIPVKPILITFDDSYQDNYDNALTILKENNCVATFFVITGMVDHNQDRLTSSEIKEMAALGMSFGSHTVSHTPLTQNSEEWLGNELAFSKQFLEELLGKPTVSIAYPEGKYTPMSISLVIEKGYDLGFTVEPGICTRQTPLLKLPRIPVFFYTGDIVEIVHKYENGM
ncbi:MAG: polysaccharide deacetylase [Firmicutes bacterium]|nr:polysaccharide deacetylase [Bacillota bacterium]